MSEEIQTETQVKEQTEESNEKEVKNTDSNTDKKLSEENEQGKDNIIFVGVKPFMNYVTGVVMQFQNKGQEEVIVSARGKFISKAVDVTEVARRTFLKNEDIKVKGIKISSEQFENKEGKRIFVSTIEIRLIK